MDKFGRLDGEHEKTQKEVSREGLESYYDLEEEGKRRRGKKTCETGTRGPSRPSRWTRICKRKRTRRGIGSRVGLEDSSDEDEDDSDSEY